LKNDFLDKALEETWNNKEKFYEENEGLPMSEIVKRIEYKYKERSTALNRTVYASSPKAAQFSDRSLSKQTERYE